MRVPLHIQMMPIAQVKSRLPLKRAAGDKRSEILRQCAKLAHLEGIKERKRQSGK